MGTVVLGQMFNEPKSLIISAAILLIIGMFWNASFRLPVIRWNMCWRCVDPFKLFKKKALELQSKPVVAGDTTRAPEQKDLSWDDVTPVDVIGLKSVIA